MRPVIPYRLAMDGWWLQESVDWLATSPAATALPDTRSAMEDDSGHEADMLAQKSIWTR